MFKQKTCPQCGNPVEDRANKVFCSPACKLRAFRQKQTREVLSPPDDVSTSASDQVLIKHTSGASPSSDTGAIKSFNSPPKKRKAELAHELKMEELRLAAEERARDHEIKRLYPPPPPPPPASSAEERYRAAQAAQVERERQKQDADLDSGYEELVGEFLNLEAQELPSYDFESLLDDVKDHEAKYRKHSGLRNHSLIPKERLDFLDGMKEVLRDTVREIAAQPTPFFGQKTGSFELKKKWRAALRDTFVKNA